jgi:hypothetical protein
MNMKTDMYRLQLFAIAGLFVVVALVGCASSSEEVTATAPGRAAQAHAATPIATFTPLPTEAASTGGEPTLGVGTPSAPTPIGTLVVREAAPEEATLSPEPEPAAEGTTGAASTHSDLPAIYAFGVSDTEVDPGERITLTWDARGESAYVCPVTYLGTIDHQCLDVPLEGPQQVTFNVEPRVWDYIGFELHVVYEGREVTELAPFHINCQGGGQWWFYRSEPYTRNIPEQCPISYPVESAGASQQFEHGTMLWQTFTGQIIVLFDDGHYQTFNLPSTGAESQSTGEEPPPGDYEPAGGFGLLWHGQVPGSEGLRAALGWAVEPEIGFTTAYQCYVEDNALTCFVRGGGASVIRLNPDGMWALWPTE